MTTETLSTNTQENLAEITAAQVAEYLANNPGFFLKHENLLGDLHLPHVSGDAVSLLERQVKILRERNIDSRKRLADILEQGQRNDALFIKTRALVLHLLDSRSLSDLAKRLTDYCEREFQVDKVLFTLFASADTPAGTQCRTVVLGEVERTLPGLLASTECVSGSFREEEFKFLFAGQQADIKSAIVLPIALEGKTTGMLALGAEDPHYFKAGMDTLFLKFVGDVIAHLLPRFFK